MHKPPETLDEYNDMYHANSGPFGLGLTGTGMSLACPFCCAPDFIKATLLGRADGVGDKPGLEEALEIGATCGSCGRGMRSIVTRANGGVRFEMVQFAGVDPPAWLAAVMPPMRRVKQ